jgi:guanine deaminase
MAIEQIIRGPLLIPREGGRVDYFADGALAADGRGVLRFAGDWAELQHQIDGGAMAVKPPPRPSPGVPGEGEIAWRNSEGVMLPPLLDVHIHVPQHPIRGRFAEGVSENDPGGRLLAGLKRNVFPAEARCDDRDYTRQVVREFLADTLSHGVVGGAAYMTVSAAATEIALEILPESWSVGLVLMNQNCPEYLRTDEINLERDITRLAGRFGRRLIVTDRFAVSVDTPLRRRASELAAQFGLRTQTHLNEQVAEKNLVEKTLYPRAASYTAVYREDGLLDHDCILAHCIHMTADEWKIVAETGSVVAHCPTSNLMLGSGVMPLASLMEHRIPFALATDVGASPTVSMLAEMGRFVQVQSGGSATEALFRSTLAPAEILGLKKHFGLLEPGRPMSFIEVQADGGADAEQAIRRLLPANLDEPEPTVRRVTVAGKSVFERAACHA